jgi:hypothetical protein
LWGEPDNRDRKQLRWNGADAYSARTIHSVFQWLALPEGSAAYALRQYWAEARR